MKLWLDDVRPAPDGWIGAKSVNEMIYLCTLFYGMGELIGQISLDHDLGEYSSQGGDGINFIDWLCEATQDPDVMSWPNAIFIHSGNPVGRDNMLRAIDRFGPYKEGYGSFRRMKD